jgi:hypothetical protein
MKLAHQHEALVAAVQANCRIADARHAADLSLCIYLLQMRELFRWEQGLAYGDTVDRNALGAWLAAREQQWAQMASRSWLPLPIGGREFNADDVEGVNAAIAGEGLIYGAGLAGAGRPSCFLAYQFEPPVQTLQEGPVLLQVCGQELARGLFAPPAVLVGGHTIVLRRDAMARWLWERFESFSVRRAGGAFKALLDHYGVHDSAGFVAALPQLVDDLSPLLLLHELGEHQAAQWLEPDWAAMRLALVHRRADVYVRAVRDQLVDLEVTLPTLVQRRDAAALHFWFANYEGARALLFPALSQAYAAWCMGDEGRLLLEAAREGAAHFRALAEQVVLLHRQRGSQARTAIEPLLTGPLAVCAAQQTRVFTRAC